MLALGTPAPDFALPDVDQKLVGLDDFKAAPALLVVFMCNHCPYVKHIQAGLVQLARDLQERGVAVVGISSNDAVAYPQDSPARMRDEARRAQYSFPYLFDQDQKVAQAYRASCTPDFFLFDRTRKLVYRGQMDDSRPGNGIPVTGRDLREAVERTLAGAAVSSHQKPSVGCNIKWKPGNEPDYY